MSIRTTVTLEEDVVERVKQESQKRGTSFKDTLNDLLRTAFVLQERGSFKRTLKIKPLAMGHNPALNNDCTEALLEYGEGPMHR